MTISAYNPKLLHPLFPRFCPGRNCSYHLDPDNYITLDGTYPVKNDSRNSGLILGSALAPPTLLIVFSKI
ncbi:hypothetical protein [Pleurocapsa sp. PCC 7319]|uniref:hypothetical protein n=1 Tax=Pleurocapsa sp. PCC 7319 TaxID=118161 RepID=UPI00192AD0E1|nr:hypothetical protein [Pleurocapsa sp. PCC 7319]